MKKVDIKVGDKIGKNYVVKSIVRTHENRFKPVFIIYNIRKQTCKAYTENEMLFILKGIKNI